jgi:hypothetical protein
VLSLAARRPFWAAIARGLTSEDAARVAGVSPPVGARWFRYCGGMPPSHLRFGRVRGRLTVPLVRRARAAGLAARPGPRGTGVRPTTRPRALDHLARVATECRVAWRRAGLSWEHPAVACRLAPRGARSRPRGRCIRASGSMYRIDWPA